MSQTRFYSCQNANRQIAGQFFEVVDIIASTAWGIFQTSDPDLIAKLDAIVADKTSAVYSITEAEYQAELDSKKKLPDWPTSRVSTPRLDATGPIKGDRPAVVVANEDKADDEEEQNAPVEIKAGEVSVSEALSVGKVDLPAETSPPQEQKKTKKKG